MRAGRMRKKLQKDPGKLHDYLPVRPIPIVVRAKKFYLVDHHHLMRALYDAEHETRGKAICVYVNVMGNASTLEDHARAELCISVRPLRRRPAAFQSSTKRFSRDENVVKPERYYYPSGPGVWNLNMASPSINR